MVASTTTTAAFICLKSFQWQKSITLRHDIHLICGLGMQCAPAHIEKYYYYVWANRPYMHTAHCCLLDQWLNREKKKKELYSMITWKFKCVPLSYKVNRRSTRSDWCVLELVYCRVHIIIVYCWSRPFLLRFSLNYSCGGRKNFSEYFLLDLGWHLSIIVIHNIIQHFRQDNKLLQTSSACAQFTRRQFNEWEFYDSELNAK